MKPATRKFWIFFGGLIVGVLLMLLIPLAVLGSGMIDMSATNEPGWLERLAAPWVVDRSVEHRAPAQKNPFADNPAVLAEGLAHYRENCVVCHGAPDLPPAELAQGLNPPAPKLHAPDTQEMADGEMFFIVKHGIRMTGMPAFAPTHSDDEIWKIVAFVKHLPQITPEERATLQARLAGEHHASKGGAETGTTPGAPGAPSVPNPAAKINPTTATDPAKAH